MPIATGAEAPDFKLQGNDDQDYTLSQFRGKKAVVLAFYPLDFSPVCTNENTCFREDLARFNQLDAQVLGISVDSRWTHKAFARSLNLNYPLLADFHPKGGAADKFGLYNAEKGMTFRATVVVDKQGKVAHVAVHTDQRKDDEILKVLESLKG